MVADCLPEAVFCRLRLLLQGAGFSSTYSCSPYLAAAQAAKCSAAYTVIVHMHLYAAQTASARRLESTWYLCFEDWCLAEGLLVLLFLELTLRCF